MLALSFQNYQDWINEYVQSDEMWLNQSLNQERVSLDVLNNKFMNNMLFNPFYSNTHFSLDSKDSFSLLDSLIVLLSRVDNHTSLNSDRLFVSLMLDILNSANSICLDLLWSLKSNNSDIRSTTMIYHSEVALAMEDIITLCFRDNTFYQSVNAVYGSYISSLSSMIPLDSSVLYYFTWAVYSLLFVIVIMSALLTRWNLLPFPTLLRLYGYVNSTALKTRIRLDAAVITLFFFILYWFAALATFDDDMEDVIEVIDSSWFYFFNILVLYLCYKHSSNYFSFLGQAVKGGRAVGFLTKQLSKDILGSFSIFLRFYILLFRIQVYDTLDDFFDSYYIFVGDFDDLEYLDDMLFSVEDQSNFSLDNNSDNDLMLDEESSDLGDIFYSYFNVWGKIFYFLFLIVEEVARLSLAFYVCYLIIFEVQSVNCSYRESSYIDNKR